MLSPFIPETAETKKQHFKGQIKSFAIGLFPRLTEPES
jgi:hypothetical protein